MKKIIILEVVFITVIMVSAIICNSASIIINGEYNNETNSSQKIVNGRLLLPIRFIAESMGLMVLWKESDGLVSISGNNKSINFSVNSKNASIDGKTVNLEVPPTISNGRVLVPARFVGEFFNAVVEWFPEIQTAYIRNENDLCKRVLSSLPDNVTQALFAVGNSNNDQNVFLWGYQKDKSDRWNLVIKPMKGIVGKKGFTLEKVEGDKKSPAGIFNIRRMFGKYKNPGTKLDYSMFGQNNFWVDDSSSKYYNTFQKGDANGRWNSSENLYKIGYIYEYFIPVEYNTVNTIAGKGSAIFIHTWEDEKTGTSGCLALKREELLSIARWLRLDSNPVLIQGTKGQIEEFLVSTL